jgi:hypothetical protein
VPLEVVARAGDEEVLGVGEALEADVHRLADLAPAAVGGDEEVARERLPAGRTIDLDLDAVVALSHADHAVLEREFRAGNLRELAVEPVDELELLALQTVRMAGVVLQRGEVELGDLAPFAVAELAHRRDETHSEQRAFRPAFLQQVERGRMEGRGAVVELDARFALEHGDRDARAREEQRRERADRTAAGDDHAIVLALHGSRYERSDIVSVRIAIRLAEERPWPAHANGSRSSPNGCTCSTPKRASSARSTASPAVRGW